MRRVTVLSEHLESRTCAGADGPRLPGTLGDSGASWTMASDGRLDPRLRRIMQKLPMPTPPVVEEGASLDEMAVLVNQWDAMMSAGAAAFGPPAHLEAKVERVEWTIPAAGGHAIEMQMLRPKGSAGVSLPCIYHLHGGGMAMMSAWDAGFYNHRVCLAAEGVAVIAVEFRNSAGGRVCGPNAPRGPYPIGINDAMAGLIHVFNNKAKYGVSTIVTNGESGGGNLACALALLAKRQGRGDLIDGVFACCPYIQGDLQTYPPECVSHWELTEPAQRSGRNLGTCFVDLYTPPGSPQRDDPVAWPLRATEGDLKGLPPHVISNNELDSLRDEGMEYYRRLRRARVPARAVIVAGTNHAADIGGTSAMEPLAFIGTRDALVCFARNPSMRSPEAKI